MSDDPLRKGSGRAPGEVPVLTQIVSDERATRRTVDNAGWVSYERSCLLTLGLLFLALPAWIWHEQGERSPTWSAWAWTLLYGFVVLGTVLLMVALFASTKSVEKWADAALTHEASVVVMIIAAPVYFILKAFTRKR